MKVLHTIVALCIVNSFSLHSMNTQFTGINQLYGTNKIRRSCTRWPWKKNNNDCVMINAYILLNRYPEQSIEKQIECYEKELADTTKQLNVEIDFFRKEELQKEVFSKQSILTQIQKANLSGKLKDKNIQEKLNTAFDNIVKNPILTSREMIYTI